MGGCWCEFEEATAQYRHPIKPGTVTVPRKPGDDLPPGTWDSIMKQCGLKA